MGHDRCNCYFSFWANFCPFQPLPLAPPPPPPPSPKSSKNQNFKKHLKKPGDINHHFTQVNQKS